MKTTLLYFLMLFATLSVSAASTEKPTTEQSSELTDNADNGAFWMVVLAGQALMSAGMTEYQADGFLFQIYGLTYWQACMWGGYHY